LALRLLVLPLAVVHDPADRGIRLCGDLDEIEVLFTSNGECLWKRLDPDLGAVWSDESYFASPNAVVDPRLVGGRRRCYLGSIFMWGVGPP
jgi:hypothetical protein